METFFNFYFSLLNYTFKSYYVVWKLDPPDEEKKEEYIV